MTRPIAQTRRNALLTRSAICGVLGALAFGAAPSLAQVTGVGNIASTTSNGGAVGVASGGGVTEITTNASRSIVNWTSLNVSTGQSLNFYFNNRGDIVLNRVAGAASIDGVLNGCLATCATPGGNVWVVSSGGVIIGANARVNSGGFLASTADVTDADLLDGNMTFAFSGVGGGTVSVDSGAQLAARGGTLALIAPVVTTAAGSSVAGGDVLYGAAEGYNITFAPDTAGDLDLVSFRLPFLATGTSQATGLDLGGDTTGTRVYASVVSKSAVTSQLLLGGTIQATAVSGEGGDIVLSAGSDIEAGVVRGVNGGIVSISATALLASGSINLVASGDVSVGSATAGDDVSLESAYRSLSVSRVELTGTGPDRDLTLKSSGDLIFGAPTPIDITANEVFSRAGTGWTSISSSAGTAAINLDSAVDLGQVVSLLSLTTNVRTGDLTLYGAASYESGVSLSAQAGGLTVTSGVHAGEDVTLAGDTIDVNEVSARRDLSVTANDGDLSVVQIQVGDDASLIATDGKATLRSAWLDGNGSDLEGDGNALILSGTGTVTLGADDFATTTGNNRVMGGSCNCETVSIDSSGGDVRVFLNYTTFIDEVSALGRVDMAAGSLGIGAVSGRDINLTVAGTGILRVEAATVGRDYSVTAGVFEGQTLAPLGTVRDFTIVDTFNGLALNDDIDVSGKLTIEVSRALTINASLTADGAIVARSHAGMRIESLGFISSSAAGDAVLLASDGDFNNDSIYGAGAVQATGSGRWLIYTQIHGYPPGHAYNNFGGLAGVSFYADAYDFATGTFAITPGAGNRFVYAYQPTLTVAPLTQTVTYTGQIPTPTAVITGLINDDNPMNAWQGTAAISGANGKNVGAYELIAALGTLASEMNYAFAFGTGTLTIDPKALTGIVVANDKTYDRTTTATGSISLVGVIAGEDVSANGTYNFQTSYADTNLAVSASAVSLLGADAANYRVASINPGLADILPKTITGVLLVSDKTYDGTTVATGAITLDGVLAGDYVTASGIFNFADKMAGTDKVVTASSASLHGFSAPNYRLEPLAASVADIGRLGLFAVLTAEDKVYDGTASATGTAELVGFIDGDLVTAEGGTYSFIDKASGLDKVVTASGLTLVGADAANYEVGVLIDAVADILRKPITGTVLADNKTYDGTVSATGSIALTGVIAGDGVAADGTYAFADKTAGVGKTVTASGVTLSGADAANYDLSSLATAVADILRKSLTGVLTVNGKTYDGTTAATGSISLTGAVVGDSVTAGGTYAFADKTAGVDKTVDAIGVTLAGADASNYDLAPLASAVADILRKHLTGTLTASDKTYDGTTAAAGAVTLGGVVAGDTVIVGSATYSFADRNAGTDKTVTATDVTLTGADVGNYTLDPLATAVADILRKAIGGTFVANDKTYDGSTTATGAVTLTGVIAGDVVTAGGGTYSFADANAGSGKTVTVAGVTLGGADGGNYVLNPLDATVANILRRTVAVAADDKNKIAGAPDPALTWRVIDGSLVAGEGFTGTIVRAAGDEVGTYIIGQGSLALSQNYELTFTPGTFVITLSSGSEPVGALRFLYPSTDFSLDEDLSADLTIIDKRSDCEGDDCDVADAGAGPVAGVF